MEKVDIRYIKCGVIHREIPFGARDDAEATAEWAKEQLDEASDVEVMDGMVDFDQNSVAAGQYFDADSLYPECVELAEKDYAVAYKTPLWDKYIDSGSSGLIEKHKSFAMGFYLTGTDGDYGTWAEFFESSDLRNDNFWPTEEFENYSDNDIKNSVAKLFNDLQEDFG